MTSHPYLCIPCRAVSRYDTHRGGSTVCPKCSRAMLWMPSQWRAPRKANRKAWALIDSGFVWWDRNAKVGGKRPQWWASGYRQKPPTMERSQTYAKRRSRWALDYLAERFGGGPR